MSVVSVIVIVNDGGVLGCNGDSFGCGVGGVCFGRIVCIRIRCMWGRV